MVLLLVGAWAFQTANRLDRLHVRYDLSWQALDGALARRAVVARAVAVDAYGGGPAGKRLAALADAAERAPRAAREAAENELSAALALVDPGRLPAALVAELADAEARVLLARRFHNDAVRDTLALRERPAVRLLRLGGTAALPTYFEIAERRRRDSARRAGQPAHVGARRAARRAGRCCCSAARTRPRRTARAAWWFTVGGAASRGRRSRGRGARTRRGDRAAGRARPTWSARYGGAMRSSSSTASVIRSEEMFFVHRTDAVRTVDGGRTGLERRTFMATAGAMRQ